MKYIATFVIVVGCAGHSSITEHRRSEMRVVSASGASEADAFVTISNKATGEREANLRTDRDGYFIWAGRDEVAVAITSARGDAWAYLPSLAPQSPIDLQLHQDCAVISGTVVGTAHPPFINLGRTGDQVGDSFGVAVAADGTFRACLPAGAYVLDLAAEWRGEPLFVRVPAANLILPVEPRAVFERAAGTLEGLTGETAEQFVAALPEATRVVALGESNHGSREFIDERTAVTLALVRARGARLVMMEAGFGEVLALDDYINGAAIDVAAAVIKLGYWVWDTRTFLGALDQLREANRTRSPADRIHLVGFDMQDTDGSIELLLAANAVAEPAISLFKRLLVKDGAAWKELSSHDRAIVTNELAAIAARRDGGGITSDANRRALAAHELSLRFHNLEATDNWEKLVGRDRGMAELALDVLSLSPSSRVVLWGHIAHFARSYTAGQPTMGEIVGRHFADAYQVFAMLAAGGSSRAWDLKHEIGVIPRELPVAPPYSLEAMLGPHSIGPITYFQFATAKGPARAWLAGLHPFRQFGAVHPSPELEQWPSELRALDGAVLFEQVHPTDPTPTGERHAK